MGYPRIKGLSMKFLDFFAPRVLAVLLVSGLVGCASSMSGSHIMQAGKPIQKIDPQKVNMAADVYRIAARDQLLIQVEGARDGGSAHKLDKGNQVKVVLTHQEDANTAYKIVPGDELSLEFPDEVEGSYQILVNPDGRIALPRLGKSMLASGLTLVDLTALSSKEYKNMFIKPKLAWAVTRAFGERLTNFNGDFYVGTEGNVAIPGLGSFYALGKTEKELERLISEFSTQRFRNHVTANVSIYDVNIREQVDNRITLNGVKMHANADGRPSRVADDGTVFVPDLGDIEAQGKTLNDFKSEVKQQLQAKYQNPIRVNVSVLEYADHNIYIGGEVRVPGRYPYTNKLSLLKLIAQAGWSNDYADMDNVLLLRPSGDNGYTIYATNLNEVIEGKGSSAQDFKINPQDLIIVPPTGIAKTNRLVTQYVKNFLPFGINVSYNINRSGFLE